MVNIWAIDANEILNAFNHISLGGKRNGLFVESGAYDGESLSNSLFF